MTVEYPERPPWLDDPVRAERVAAVFRRALARLRAERAEAEAGSEPPA